MLRLPGIPSLRHLRDSLFLVVALLCLAQSASGVTLNGVDYVDLRDVAGRFGMKFSWVEKGKSLELSSEWTRMRFEKDKRETAINGLRIHLGYAIAENQGKLYLSESDYRHQLQTILTPQVFPAPGVVRTIMLDPGHGDSDPGAQNGSLGLKEKSLALDLAKRVQARLEAAGYRVLLTRNRDVFIPLPDRAKLANDSGADLFLSLHFNAAGSSKVAGAETFALTPRYQPSTSRTHLVDSDRVSSPGNAHDPWNALLGFYVQRSLVDALPTPDRGLKRARFAVLRDLEMPGILIEGGFVSNDREGRNIGSAGYRNRIATAIVEGVRTYDRTVTRLGKGD